MIDLSIYFQPIAPDLTYTERQLGAQIKCYQTDFPDLNESGCAIISIPEFRGASVDQYAVPAFRSALYQLHPETTWTKNIYDLGTIQPGATIADTYFALSNVVSELVKKNILPIVIGGSQDLTMAIYQGYERLEQLVNTCSIDRSIDIGSAEETLNSKNYLSHMLLQRPCYLFNHAIIGLQQPYASAAEHELFEKLFFDLSPW